MHTDLAGQLLTVLLATFGKENHVTTQIMYANVTIFIYLWLAAKLEEDIESTGDWKQSAIWAWDMHYKFAPCGTHYYKSYSYRNTGTWPESRKQEDDAPEVNQRSSYFSTIFKSFAKGTTGMPDISKAFVWVSSLIAIFTTETLPCDD